MGEYDRAIELHQQHRALAGEAGDLEDMAGSLNNEGNCWKSLAKFETAIEMYEKAGAEERAASTLHLLYLILALPYTCSTREAGAKERAASTLYLLYLIHALPYTCSTLYLLYAGH